MYVLRLRNGDKVISSRYHQHQIRSLLEAGR
jgi:hypothetical protein